MFGNEEHMEHWELSIVIESVPEEVSGVTDKWHRVVETVKDDCGRLREQDFMVLRNPGFLS